MADVRDDSSLVLATLEVRIREEEEDLFQLQVEESVINPIKRWGEEALLRSVEKSTWLAEGPDPLSPARGLPF
jgi:hypothetical protein